MFDPELIVLPPGVEAAWQRVRLRWMLTLVTPVLYLFVAQILRAYGWIGRDVAPWDGPAAWGIAAAGALVALGGAGWLRHRQRAAVDRHADDPALALERWTLYFYWMATLADTLAFASLLYFYFSGRFNALMAGGIVAYGAYALAYPRRADLIHLDDLPDADEDE